MTHCVYIIKPEAMAHRKEIYALIEGAGLRIVSAKLVNLSEIAIDVLYPFLGSDLRDATLYSFSLGPCEIGIVEGVHAIARLSELTGDSPNPANCNRSTIRARFGLSRPIKMGTAFYYFNGFHTSRNALEAKRDLTLFEGLHDESGGSATGAPG